MNIFDSVMKISASGVQGSFAVILAAGIFLYIAWNIFEVTNGEQETCYGLVVEKTNAGSIGLLGMAASVFVISLVIFAYSMGGHLIGEVKTYRIEADRAAAADFDALMPGDASEIIWEMQEEAENTIPAVLNGKGNADIFLLNNGPAP